MFKYLKDFPNLITITGLILITIALNLIFHNLYEISLVLLMWAVYLDHIDGWLARKLSAKRAEIFSKFGGELDSLTDFVSAAIAPWLIIASLNFDIVLTTISAIFIFIAAAMRVAYYNTFGLSNGKFYGLSLTYNIPIFSFIFIISKITDYTKILNILPYILISLSILHLSPIRLPPVRGIGFILIFCYSLFLTFIMLFF